MRNSKTHSLANSFGITRKDGASTEAMGLNPNLNIEDEYVENLLKQVHFLNLEIKLVKQKQGENKGLGIMGLLNKDQQPVVEHAVQSNLKFQSMKGNLQGIVNDLQTKNFMLEDENLAVKAQKEYLASIAKDTEKKNFENRIDVQKQLTENSQKLRTLQTRFADLTAESNKIQENFGTVEEEYSKLIRSQKLKQINYEISDDLLKEEHGVNGDNVKEKKNVITQHDKRLQQADIIFRADPRYMQFIDENQQLKERLKKSERELFDLTYNAKEKQELKKLAQRNRDVEVDLKKQAEHDLERTKVKLNQKKEQFDRKILDRKNKVEAQPQLRKLQAQFTKKDRQLADLRKKLETSEANYKKLREDIVKLSIHYDDMKVRNAKLADQEKVLTTEVNSAEVELNKSNIETERNENELTKLTVEYDEASQRLRKLEAELTYLTAKYEFLEKNVHLDDDMKNVRIDELRNIAQSNLVVNSTINDLMGKWEQMRKFSRDSS